jgi:glutamyl-tRNA synthetase
MSKVATRFAPSPTGPLHIGGIRTALFNWLFSKNQKGIFHLRIEDTDKERSKEEYKKQIIQSLKWIGIQADEEEYIQSTKIKKHVEIVNKLLDKGFAYKCYCTEHKIEEEKKRAKQKKLPYIYNRKCRDIKDVPKNIDPVIRFKSKIEGSSTLNDLVQGKVNIENATIEDFIILRKDGTPTYNLSAAADDKEMAITHIIRGDDHKMNTFKQMQIFQSMGWDLPTYVHIPLIHTSDGKKLSKRDKASTLDDYKKIGIMADALRNYLLRLGWSFKDKEVFTLNESIKHFNIEGIGKSPSKLDMSRILSMNEHYIKNMNENDLFDHLIKYCESYKDKIDNKGEKIKKSLIFLKNKAKTLEDIFNNAQYLIKDKIQISSEDIKLLDNLSKTILKDFLKEFEKLSNINKENLEKIINNLIKSNKTNFKGVGQPLRIALVGSKFGPGIYDIILSLDKNEVVQRLKAAN